VEDHESPELYLELWPSPDTTDRAVVLAALPGVTRVSCWANANPNRTDLPRRIEEGAVLGLAEVDSGFRAPPQGFHFRRTRRPGQGVLTGQPTIGLLIVFISPRQPADAQALRDWADFVHIRHIAEAAVPGYGMITPYERVGAEPPRYLHLYEFTAPDAERVFQSMTPLVEARFGPRGSSAFDAWAWHPALRIEYVNTFNLLGSAQRD
jgi:hypothetical protein